jgi:hypothetical protein
MSRTIRKHLDGEYIIRGKIIHWDDIDWKEFPCRMGFHYRERIIKNKRDRKPFGKPPKWFKQMNRRWERNKEKQCAGVDCI